MLDFQKSYCSAVECSEKIWNCISLSLPIWCEVIQNSALELFWIPALSTLLTCDIIRRVTLTLSWKLSSSFFHYIILAVGFHHDQLDLGLLSQLISREYVSILRCIINKINDKHHGESISQLWNVFYFSLFCELHSIHFPI